MWWSTSVIAGHITSEDIWGEIHRQARSGLQNRGVPRPNTSSLSSLQITFQNILREDRKAPGGCFPHPRHLGLFSQQQAQAFLQLCKREAGYYTVTFDPILRSAEFTLRTGEQAPVCDAQ